MKLPCDVIIHCEPNEKGTVVTMTGWNELVRCKECLKKDICSMYRQCKDDYGYCSWAKRKEE